MLLILSTLLYANPQWISAQKIQWKPAKAIYPDGSVIEGLLKSKKNNFWYYLILDTNGEKVYLYPEEVSEVVCGEYYFVSLCYTQAKYNHVTHSFAHVLAGSDILLAYTRYSHWVCNCSKGERYSWGYFLISGSKYQLVKVHKRMQTVVNVDEVYEFLINENLSVSIDEIKDIEGIKNVLKQR